VEGGILNLGREAQDYARFAAFRFVAFFAVFFAAFFVVFFAAFFAVLRTAFFFAGMMLVMRVSE
jgi:hypothetical protein